MEILIKKDKQQCFLFIKKKKEKNTERSQKIVRGL